MSKLMMESDREDWSEYKSKDNRKKKRPDRSTRDKKHQFEESESPRG